MAGIMPYLPIIIGFVVVIVIIAILSASFRKVVPTNMVHIVQSGKKTVSFGTDQTGRNVYFAWPSWIPFFGVTVIQLPVSNFDLPLKDYEAYDKDRVPFKVDVASFFRIKDTSLAAARVSDIATLKAQLMQIVQGAVRKVLSSDVIDAIMLERSKFGDAFTAEVQDQLAEWGVVSVKSMELMDIRDSHDSKVIENIMAKKTSHIAMESRMEVAKNHQAAETAEIAAKQAVDIRKQDAEEQVGKRTATKDKEVGIATQNAKQEILTQEKETKSREMEVKKVMTVREADIEKEKQVVLANQNKETTVIIADGKLAATTKESDGIKLLGAAKADAEKNMQMAPVSAMIALAKEIGTNKGYQEYLAMIESIKAYKDVGGKQAEALQKADVKIISNAGNPTQGMKSAMDLFTTTGGTNLSAMIEAFAQTPLGKAALDAFGVEVPEKEIKNDAEVTEKKENSKKLSDEK